MGLYSLMDSPAALSVAARFALIIDGLRAAVAARIADYPITGPMVVYICNRLNRINQRFQALTALILSGKLPAERVYRPRAARETAAVPPADPEAAVAEIPYPAWRLLPMRRFAWLCIVAHNRAGPANAAIFAGALRSLLGEPEMAALLAATSRMANLLRPLCWGLGIEASMLRSRPAAPTDVAAAPAAVDDAERGGIVPDHATAAMRVAGGGKPSAATVINAACVPGLFSPA
jgi:hypothetical protein